MTNLCRRVIRRNVWFGQYPSLFCLCLLQQCCEAIVMEFYLLLSCTWVSSFGYKSGNKNITESDHQHVLLASTCKVTTLKVRQLKNSLLVFERTYCWSGQAERGEEGIVCFGQGSLPKGMSMFYLNAESGKEVIHHSYLWSICFISMKPFAVGQREKKAQWDDFSKFGKWQEHCGICSLTLKEKSFAPLPVWEATVLLAVYFLKASKKNCSFLQRREHSVMCCHIFVPHFPRTALPCQQDKRFSLFKDAVGRNESKICLHAYMFIMLFRKYILEKQKTREDGSRLQSFL